MGLEIPGYKILRTLGRGGMATVYLAQQDIFEREVALKVMSKALAENESFGKRFFREAKIVSQLVHPNIVTVYDVGLEDGNYYLSMEYIDGKDLKAVRQTLSLKQKIEAVKDIAKALDYAGIKGYVHRDIKPENILLNSADGRAVLTDFGIARAAETDTAMTQTGIAIGTPHYMSPEQAKGKTVDARSDIYGLGVVFFLLLTGRVPYDAESAVAIGIKHITEPVPLLPDALASLQPMIDDLLAKKPEDRYQRGGELLEDLNRIDIRLLEQSIVYDREMQPVDDYLDSESPTQPGLGAVTGEVPLVYDQKETLINQGSGIGQWLVAFLIVSSLVTWVLYYQRPDLIAPLFEQGKQFVEDKYDDTKKWVEPKAGQTQSDSNVPRAVDKRVVINEKRVKPAKPQPTAEILPQKKSVEPELLLKPVVADEVIPVDVLRQAEVKTNTPVPSTVIEEYHERLRALESLYQDDSTYLSELVALYRATLSDYPRDIESADALDALRASELMEAEALLARDKAAAGRKKVEQLNALFPEIDVPTIADLRDQVETLEKIERLLAEAKQLRKKNKWSEPRGRSALDRYEQVLKLDADNTRALKGKRELAGLHAQKASRELEAGSLSMAKFDIDRALAIDSRSESAKALRTKISGVIQHRESLDKWMKLAEQRMSGRRYFVPNNDNAFYYYQKILEREPNNSRAITGQKQVVDGFARNIWSLVGNEEFTEARAELAAALRLLPRNQRLQSLSAAVEEVVAEKISGG